MYAFKLRRGTALDWSSENPTLRSGEPGYEIDSGKFKIGDGFTVWTSLPYFVNEDVIQQLIENSMSSFVVSPTRPVGYPDNTVWIEPII